LWVYWGLTYVGQTDGTATCCGREVQCGWRTKINWTKSAHHN